MEKLFYTGFFCSFFFIEIMEFWKQKKKKKLNVYFVILKLIEVFFIKVLGGVEVKKRIKEKKKLNLQKKKNDENKGGNMKCI